MARVYRAAQSGYMGFRKEVALKQILPNKADEETTEKLTTALVNEARMLSRLQHRNVVEVYDLDKVGDILYIAMEYVRGTTLADVIRQIPTQGPIPIRIAAEIAVQLCGGLAYAHSVTDESGNPLNLIHRDLKPANVMITRSGIVKIMDFGVARAATNLTKTTTGSAKGTPVYMSPEQTEGLDIDHRSDIFSLSSVITETITGEMTFHGSQLYVVMRKVCNAEVGESLEKVALRVPELAPILQRGFARNPADRHPSAADMEIEIRHTLGTLPGDVGLSEWLVEWMGEDAILAWDSSPIRQIAPSQTTMNWESGRKGQPEDQHQDSDSVDLPAGSRDKSEASPGFTTRFTEGPAWSLVAVLSVILAVVVVVGSVVGFGIYQNRKSSNSEAGSALALPGHHEALNPEATDPSNTAESAKIGPAEVVPLTNTSETSGSATPTRAESDSITESSSTAKELSEPAAGPAPPPVVEVSVAAAEVADGETTPEPTKAIRTVSKGMLMIDSDPWSSVFIDGVDHGTTPISVTVSAGEHKIEVRCMGKGTPVRASVEVEADGKSPFFKRFASKHCP